MPPPGDVLTVVFTAWAAGTATFAAVTRLRGEVQPGHFKVCWLVVAGLALAGAAVGGFAWEPLVLGSLALVTFVAIYVRGLDRIVGVVPGLASLPLLWSTLSRGLDASVLASPVSVDRPTLFVLEFGIGHLLVGFAAAWLLGAVTNAMLLGHWHLNQPRLGTGPLRMVVLLTWEGLALFLAAVGAMVAQRWTDGSAAAFGGMTAIAFAVFTVILTAMVQHLVKSRSIMSATGILYLMVLLCFVSAFTGVLGALSVPGA